MKQVKYLLGGKKKRVHVDRNKDGLQERVTPFQSFKSLIWGISSRFPLSNHLDLAGSDLVFGVSQDPPMCEHTSLSQD